MSLITEQNIETATSSTAASAPESALAKAVVQNDDAHGLMQTVEQLGRNSAEMQVQLHNLRTELARSSAAIAQTTQRTGIVLILALVAATYLISRAVDFAPAVTAEAVPVATNEGVERKVGELGITLDQIKAQLASLAGSLAEQKQTMELAAKVNAGAAKPAPPAGKLDCAKLPGDLKASEADFSIQFQSGSAKILPASEVTLDGIAKMLALVPNHCVIIEGHADASGKSEKNIALSKERANSVLDYIATKSNLNRDQLVAVGKGSSNPPAGTDALDPANRRVIFKVVPPGS